MKIYDESLYCQECAREISVVVAKFGDSLCEECYNRITQPAPLQQSEYERLMDEVAHATQMVNEWLDRQEDLIEQARVARGKEVELAPPLDKYEYLAQEDVEHTRNGYGGAGTMYNTEIACDLCGQFFDGRTTYCPDCEKGE